MNEPNEKPTHITAQALYEEALKLSAEEREVLSIMLDQSLTSFDDWFATPEIAQAWREEIHRRKQAIDEGKAKMLDGEQVFRDLRRKHSL